MSESLALVATCAAGLEELLDQELAGLGFTAREPQRGAVTFAGGWRDCWRANWRLRTANRVLVELASWPAADGAALAAGARALAAGRVPAPRPSIAAPGPDLASPGPDLTAPRAGVAAPGPDLASPGPDLAAPRPDFASRGPDLAAPGLAPPAIDLASPGLDVAALLHPDRSFVIEATATASQVRDTRWAALSAKDGLVDGQRERWGRRADVDRESADSQLRLRLHADRATLLLDTSGEPLDRRGYRALSTAAPVRETLAAACVLASGWDGLGAVVDPMCGSGTLLVEAGWLALGVPPGQLRPAGAGWAFERLPGFDAEVFAAIRAEPLPVPGPGVRLLGNDRSAEALRAARANLERAGLRQRAQLIRGDAADCRTPAGRGVSPGLLVVNPPYGQRTAADAGHWRALGDLLKQHFRGWRAAVLAGGEGLGKHIGLRPRRRLPVKNGALDARILIFDLF